MQERKVNFLISTMPWSVLRPVTSQGLLAACRADASLHPRHLPGDQRPTQSPIVAVWRSSFYCWPAPETRVTLKGLETPLLPALLLPCISPHNLTWQYRKW